MKYLNRMRQAFILGLSVSLAGPGFFWLGTKEGGRSWYAEAQTTPVTTPQVTGESSAPVYKPPLRGAPAGRIGGGTRGSNDPLPSIEVLAPDHTGFTVHEQPTLYWYVSRVPTQPIEVTIIEAQGVQPLFETRLTSLPQAGLQRLRLTDYSIRLRPGVPYRWSVAVIADPENRSQDVVAGGSIELMTLSDTLKSQLASSKETDQPRLYAEAGIWYDVMATLGELIDHAPQNTTLRQQRAALLTQVGVPMAAAADLR